MTELWTGYLCHVVIWNKALTQSEIYLLAVEIPTWQIVASIVVMLAVVAIVVLGCQV